jgi:quercetin dioxygenase-like cupin family protein
MRRNHMMVLGGIVLAGSVALCVTAPAQEKREAVLEGRCIVSRPADYKVILAEWGDLTWFVSKEQKSSETLTVGKAVLKPGFESPRHYHPNCDEVLHVVKGKISHAVEGGKTVEMSEGDTIMIPANIRHNAKNIGREEAVMFLSFSSAERKAVNE